MQNITSIQDLKTIVNENGEMVISIDNNNIVLIKMEDYKKKILNKDIEDHLLRAEDDIEKGKVRDAREVFKEWKEKYGI